MIESEIRTGCGFKEGRVLSFLRKYYLKVDEIKQVFDLDSIPSTASTNYELVIYVISSPLVFTRLFIWLFIGKRSSYTSC